MLITMVVACGVGVLAIAGFTAAGSRRRGAGIPMAALAGLCFPVTWAAWYVRDERPYQRTS
jgi:hypothetical protein